MKNEQRVENVKRRCPQNMGVSETYVSKGYPNRLKCLPYGHPRTPDHLEINVGI